MPTKAKELTYATVNFDDPAEVKEFHRQEQRKAGIRIRKAVKELQEKGILDEHGRRISKELPPDMREDSDCDL